MKIGLHLGRYDFSGGPADLGGTLGRIAETADASGFASLWVMDHLFQLGEGSSEAHGPVDGSMLEGTATLAFLTARTNHIQLGLLVGCPLFRHPAVLVKSMTTIDVLSGGRSTFGLGAGWYEREASGLGVPLPSPGERFERLEETILIAKHLWADNRTPFVGKHYRLDEPISRPQPLSRPRPPIVIGGSGERRTLRLVAQYADGWNFVMGAPLALPEFGALHSPLSESLAILDRKLAVLDRHCHDVGRSSAKIEKSVVTYIKLGPNAMSAEEIVEAGGLLAQRGVTHLILNILDVETIAPLEAIARDVIPQVGSL